MTGPKAEKRTVVVVGAGISGLAMAWSLAERGWQVHVLEKATDLRSGGWMLGLSGPGLDTVKAMGLYGELRETAHVSRRKIFYSRTGREIFRLSFSAIIDGTDYLLLNRNEIVDALYARTLDRADIRFGTTLTQANESPAGIDVILSSGETLAADLLIGADGVRSQVRSTFFGPDAEFMRTLGYRYAAYEGENILGLDADSAFYLAPGHFAEFYPVASDRIAALQVWPSVLTDWVPPQDRWELLYQCAQKMHPAIHAVLDTADKDKVPVFDHLAMVRMPAWHRGRILLTGDAAHCLTFISGQGAGMALAAAPILASALDQHGLQQGLAAYEQRMRPAILQLQKHSLTRARGMVPKSTLSYWLGICYMYLMRNRKRPFGKFLDAERIATASLARPAD